MNDECTKDPTKISDMLIDSAIAHLKKYNIYGCADEVEQLRKHRTTLLAEVGQWKRWSTLDREESTFAPFDLPSVKTRHYLADNDKTCDFQTLHHDRKELLEYVEILLADNKVLRAFCFSLGSEAGVSYDEVKELLDPASTQQEPELFNAKPCIHEWFPKFMEMDDCGTMEEIGDECKKCGAFRNDSA